MLVRMPAVTAHCVKAKRSLSTAAPRSWATGRTRELYGSQRWTRHSGRAMWFSLALLALSPIGAHPGRHAERHAHTPAHMRHSVPHAPMATLASSRRARLAAVSFTLYYCA